MDKLIILAILLVALLAVIIFLAIRGKKNIIYKMLYTLIDRAEAKFGSKAGKLKFSYVLEQAYAKLPSIVKVFITYNMLEKWIETALVEMKEYWAEKASITDDETGDATGDEFVIIKGFANDVTSNN